MKRARPLISLRRALADAQLLGGAMVGDSWTPWRTLLIALAGEKLTTSERRVFVKLTGRQREPLTRVEEFVAVVGRRGGKTFAGAVLLVYLATMIDYSDVLTTGERGVALFIAQNQRTAQVAFDYASGIIDSVPMLRAMVTARTADSISLNNGVDLEVRTASFRGLRGITAVAVLADEVAFWMIEGSANPDSEILNALRPALSSTSGLLAVLSSPYAQVGELWQLYDRHYGRRGDPKVLVARGGSRQFNSTLSQRIVDRAMQRDPQFAQAEYLGMFRTDVSGFIDRDILRASVDVGVHARAALPGARYTAFVDASSGRGDSFAAAICHGEGERLVLDYVFEKRPPFNASEAVAEVCALLKSFRIFEARGDRYSIGFLEAEFGRWGIKYVPAELDRSELFLGALPLFTSGRVRLLDNARLIDQFAQLERRTGSSGRDHVTHPRTGHDDLANATAGGLVTASTRSFAITAEIANELLARIAATPPHRAGANVYNVWPLNRPSPQLQRAFIPVERRTMPLSALPPEKRGGSS
jgi:hypothetical protein